MDLFNTNLGKIVVIILFLVNIFSFFIIVRDKHKAINRKNDKRIPEGLIFFMAVIFGGIGVYFGMLISHHKTKKWYFQFGIPLLIFQNLATIYMLLKVITEN